MPKQLSVAATVVACSMATLVPSDGAAYPTTPVSYGQNPIWSAGGYIDRHDIATLVDSVPAGQTLVVTDVHITVAGNYGDWDCRTQWRAKVQSKSPGGSTTDLAWYNLRHVGTGDSNNESMINATFSSGLPVVSGDSLQVHAHLSAVSSCGADSGRLYYTLSGYYAQN